MDIVKYIAPSIVAFVFSLIATVPLVKWRLKTTEDITRTQGRKIEKQSESQHKLEMKILESGRDLSAKSMEKVSEALLVIAESNTKFQYILEGQTELIKKAHESSIRAHERIDTLIKETDYNFKQAAKELVSHKYFDDVIKNISSQR